MNRLREKAERDAQLSSTHYEHSILVSKNDIVIVDELKIVSACLYLLILARLFVRILWGVKIESVFVVKALGLQTTTVYHSNFKSSKFIPWHSINDVIINEAIVMQRVIFYLAVLVKPDNKGRGELIIPIFTQAQPRLSELKKIYTKIQFILRN